MERINDNLIDYLAKDYIYSLDDHFERSRARMVLWIAILFGLILVACYPLLPQSILLTIIYSMVLVVCLSIPYLIKKQKDHAFSGKILLSMLMGINFLLHILINPPNLLATGIWFIVFTMAASFILGRKWLISYVFITLLAITVTSFFREFNFDLGALLNIQEHSMKVGYATPLRLAGPFFLVYFILSQFIRYKDITDDNVLKLLKTQQDLNKRLQKSEAKYRKIIEGADDMIYEVDEKGYFTFMNPSMSKVTGYVMKEEPISFTSPIPMEFLPTQLAFFRNQFKTQTPITYSEFPIYTKSGTTIWIGQKTNMFFNKNGRMVNALCLARDISAQKETEERLIEAKDRAIKASLVKAQFLSSMSHEIRTPMNAVIGLVHLLLQEDPRKDQVDHLKTLMFSAENLLKLINNILDFSKIEAGKIDIIHKEFNLKDIVNSLNHGFSMQAKEKQITFEVNLDHRIPNTIIGDPLRISQILNNLVSNAVKFTDNGGVTVYITPRIITDQFIDIYFAIRDTGIGIPKEKLSAVFEDFIQVNEDTLRQGTGLGLSITKELLELQGSRIQLESTYGEGSTFYFTLRFKQISKLRQQLPKEKKAKKLSPLKDSLKGVQLLLVEDNKINQKVATNFLYKWGIEVDIADNGAIAVEKVKNKEYDLILMDLQMPVMNGIEATKAIRALGSAYLNLPIIALTASAVLEVRDNAIQSGLNDFITKPFTPKRLYEKIAEYSTVEV